MVGEWSEEIDFATSMDDREHLGFSFDDNPLKCKTLHSIKAKEFENIIPQEFRRKIGRLDEKHYKDKRTMLTSGQIVQQIFSFFEIKQNPGTNDYHGRFAQHRAAHRQPQADQAWEEMMLSLNNCG